MAKKRELSRDFDSKSVEFVKKIGNKFSKFSLSIVFYIVTLEMTLFSNVSTENSIKESRLQFLRQIPFAYPAEYSILSNVMLFRWFVGMLLKSFGYMYEAIVNLRSKPNTYKPRSQIIPYEILKKYNHKQNHDTALFRLSLLAAINIVTQSPRLTLACQRSFRSQMRKYRGNQGFLLTNKVPNEKCYHVLEVFYSSVNAMNS